MPRVTIATLALLGSFLLPTASAAGGERPAFTFSHGISVGHWMAKMNGAYAGDWFTRADVGWIAAHRFDHIRWPVDGRLWLRADGSLDESKIVPLVAAVRWARDLGLGSVLDMHFLPGDPAAPYNPDSQDTAIFTDPAVRARAAAFWGAVAMRLADEGPWIRFEILNEPNAPENEQLNILNGVCLAAIRAVDATRVVYLTSNRNSVFETLPDVVLPDDPHIVLKLHYDEPMIFTHQRASWKHLPPDMPLVHFPGRVPDLSAFVPPGHWAASLSGTELTVEKVQADFDRAAAWMAEHYPNVPMHLGGFGSYEQAPAESRITLARTVRRAAESHGWGWTVWDYRSSFGVRDAAGNPTAALPGLFDEPSP